MLPQHLYSEGSSLSFWILGSFSVICEPLSREDAAFLCSPSFAGTLIASHCIGIDQNQLFLKAIWILALDLRDKVQLRFYYLWLQCISFSLSGFTRIILEGRWRRAIFKKNVFSEFSVESSFSRWIVWTVFVSFCTCKFISIYFFHAIFLLLLWKKCDCFNSLNWGENSMAWNAFWATFLLFLPLYGQC